MFFSHESRREGRYRVLIAGCGMVGNALGRSLAAAGHRVWGLRRRPSLLSDGISPIGADLTRSDTFPGLPEGLDFVVYSVSSDARTDEAYSQAYVGGLRNLLSILDRQKQKPRRVLYASSTAVYGQTGGQWVDEDSETEPSRFNGVRMIEGERLLRAHPFSGTAIRFAGLYGPDRVRLLTRVLRGEECCVRGRKVFTNRIHVRDAAAVIQHLMSLANPEPVYIAGDCEPVERCRLLRWLAEELGVRPPRVVDSEPKPRFRGNKRCRNGRLLRSGYRFAYPTFREGYRAIIRTLDLGSGAIRPEDGGR